MKTLTLLVCILLLLGLTRAHGRAAQLVRTEIDKVYTDESHCLVLPEIRGDKDSSISCYCRDAIVDARYVWRTYLLSGKDRNLNGTYLTLLTNAGQMCGKGYDVSKAASDQEWRWNGPEVTRTYPSDSKIEEIRPDSKGFRTVQYLVQVTYRDQQGRITKVDNYTALDRLPPNFKK